MKPFPLICIICLFASCPSWASDQNDRFLEFQEDNDTLTYDLNTIQMIGPGRFTITHTTIDQPDVMKFKLKMLATLRTYCTRPDGKYPPPADIFTLGPPDMAVENIEVKSSETKLAGKPYLNKMVMGSYPYKRFAFNVERGEESFNFLHCKDPLKTENEYYLEAFSVIMNGIRTKELFDCKRGQAGIFLFGKENDDPTKAVTFFVSPNTRMHRYYFGVCHWVTHEEPYTPKQP